MSSTVLFTTFSVPVTDNLVQPSSTTNSNSSSSTVTAKTTCSNFNVLSTTTTRANVNSRTTCTASDLHKVWILCSIARCRVWPRHSWLPFYCLKKPGKHSLFINCCLIDIYIIYLSTQAQVDIALAWIPEHLIDTQDLGTFIGLDGTLASEQGDATKRMERQDV